MNKEELYGFQCKECGWIYAEPYDLSDRFAEYPPCPDCGCRDVVMYDEELSFEINDEFCNDDEE